MKRITLFSFGYWGWGNATKQLVQAVDAVEKSRGFKPPIFVDIRIRRTGRAPGFQQNKFGELLGETRHQWFKGLGNKYILTHTGPRIQILNPAKAHDLLDLALRAAKDRQRVIFFCDCEWARVDGKPACHRTKVTELVLKEAQRRGMALEVVEWPGGEAESVTLNISRTDFSSIGRGRKTIPLNRQLPSPEIAGLPWGSVVRLTVDDDELPVIAGPAKCGKTEEWRIPILKHLIPASSSREIAKAAADKRQFYGFEPQFS